VRPSLHELSHTLEWATGLAPVARLRERCRSEVEENIVPGHLFAVLLRVDVHDKLLFCPGLDGRH
jgi:hypothetical protein